MLAQRSEIPCNNIVIIVNNNCVPSATEQIYNKYNLKYVYNKYKINRIM